MRRLLLLSLLFSLPLSAAEFFVTNTNDSGPGSLREAILAANATQCGTFNVGPCVVAFRIPPPVPAEGWFTIRPQSPLPMLERREISIDGLRQTNYTGNTNPYGPEIEIDGSAAGDTEGIKYLRSGFGVLLGLAINNFAGNGVVADASHGVHVTGCFIGVDPTGRFARPNGANGILMINSQVIRINGNIVSANRGNGIFLHNGTGEIFGNSIGLGRSLAYRLPNGAHGIDVRGALSIAENEIAYNTLHGINAHPQTSSFISRNRIHRNGLLSIDYGSNGPDPINPAVVRNAPVLTFAQETRVHAARVFRGNVRSTPNTVIGIEFFGAPHRSELGLAEAQVYLGAVEVTTDASGYAEFTYESTEAGMYDGWVAASAVSPFGTSELSAAIPFDTGAIEVTTAAASGNGSLAAAIERANGETCSAEQPCWIDLRVPEHELTGDVARITASLPELVNDHVIVNGKAQAWYTADRIDGAHVELRGELRLGSVARAVRGVTVQGLAINSSAGNGITARLAPELGALLIRDVFVGTDATGTVAIPNAGNGIHLISSRPVRPFHESVVASIETSVVSGNGGDGIVTEGGAYDVAGSFVGTDRTRRLALGNGRNGMFVSDGAAVNVFTSVAAFNGAAGIASSPNAVAVHAQSATTFANGGLGIDRDANGVSPNDAADDVTDKPEILSATYDDSRNLTIIRARIPSAIPEFRIVGFPSNWLTIPAFYTSAAPDPSGFGEGERFHPLQRREDYTPDVETWAIDGDQRGRYVTMTRTLAFCWWEQGCRGLDTSEYSNTVLVQ